MSRKYLPPPTPEGYIEFLSGNNFEGVVNRAQRQIDLHIRYLERQKVIERFRVVSGEHGKFDLHGTPWLGKLDVEVIDAINNWGLHFFSSLHDRE